MKPQESISKLLSNFKGDSPGAKDDEKWGETPCAFIELNNGVTPPSNDELNAWCRQHLAAFKVPKHFVFEELPKTSTGKVQKFVLRERAMEI